MNKRVTITVGGATFAATLLDTRAAAAFQAMLPLTMDMTDLNANEKLHDLPRDLPGDPVTPGTIHNGDVMLYGSNTVVLFYKTFPTTYSYRVDDPEGLAATLGPGDVTVTFAR